MVGRARGRIFDRGDPGRVGREVCVGKPRAVGQHDRAAVRRHRATLDPGPFCGRLFERLAGHGTGLAQRFMHISGRRRAAGDLNAQQFRDVRHASPRQFRNHAVVVQWKRQTIRDDSAVVIGRVRLSGIEPRAVRIDVQLFCDQVGLKRRDALTEVCPRHDQGDPILVDLHEGCESSLSLGHIVQQRVGDRAGHHKGPKRNATDDSSGPDQKAAAGDFSGTAHGSLPNS